MTSDIFLEYQQSINDEPTFAKICLECFDIAAEKDKWKADSTIFDYQSILIKIIKHDCVNNRSIEVLRLKDFQLAIEEYRQEEKGEENSQGLKYRIQRIIDDVYIAGLDKGLIQADYIDARVRRELNLYENDDNLSRHPKVKKEYLLIRKSFSPSEDSKLASYFNNYTPELITGPQLGVLIMFLTGMRNAEVAGLTYGALFKTDEFMIPLLRVYQTPDNENPGQRKIGGKTANMFRNIPVYASLYSFLMNRRQFVYNQVRGEKTEIDSYMTDKPIASDAEFEAITPKMINDEAKKIFEACEIDTRKIYESLRYEALCEREIDDDEDEGFVIKEKDYTAYLFRRNFGTSLYNLGFAEHEIEYLMGHKIESSLYRRSFFTNEDELKHLYDLMCNHPRHKILFHGKMNQERNNLSEMRGKYPSGSFNTPYERKELKYILDIWTKRYKSNN